MQRGAIKKARLFLPIDAYRAGIAANADGTGFDATSVCVSGVSMSAVRTEGDQTYGTAVAVVSAATQATQKVDPPALCALSPHDRDLISSQLTGRTDLLVVSYGNADIDGLRGEGDSPRVRLPQGDGKSVGILSTNRRLWIFVIRPDGYPSQVTVDGTAQLSGPAIQGSTFTQTSPLGGSTAEVAPTAASGLSRFCFTDVWSAAPRAPGSIKISTQLTDANGNAYKPSAHIDEVLIEQRYIGAIRVGVGAIVPFGQNPSGIGTSTYSIRSSPSGGTGIYKDSWSLADLELVGGYTAFLGRGRRLSELADGGVGLFGGLGLIAVSPNSGNVTGLTSAYIGVEYAISGIQFLALAGARRETVLLSPYKVGDHVASNTTITGTSISPALGLAIGFTSDVLKIPGANFP